MIGSPEVSRPQPPSQRFVASYGAKTTLALCWILLGSTAVGQSPFSPPPPPQAAPSSVRGVAPAPQLSSPAVVAPEAAPRTAPVSAPPTGQSAPLTPTAAGGLQPVEGGQIVARVDGLIVLASDVLWQVDQLIAANRDRIPADKIAEVKQMFLRQQVMGMIDTKILYADFRRKVPAENLPSILENLAKPFEEQEVPRLVKMFDLNDRTELDALLRQSGTSIVDMQQQFNERTIAGEWLRQMMPKPKEVTHEEMLAYYNGHKKDFEYPAQAKWEELMVSFDRLGGDRKAAWQAITGLGNEVWGRVSERPGLRGAVFADTAQQKSHGFTAKQGGQHEWTTKGALRCKEIDQALFSLKVGQLSNVIESERGFHIVRVLDRKEAGRTPFTAAQAKIRKELGKDQRKDLAQSEMAKIRKKSRVWTMFDGDLSIAELNNRLDSSKRR
ncbi:MAG: peptidylprolyl isomerase [Bythopirellula sp.]